LGRAEPNDDEGEAVIVSATELTVMLVLGLVAIGLIVLWILNRHRS
jgi:hypothetical protein